MASPQAPDSPTVARLIVHCADRPGIVAAVSQFLAERGANIIESDQSTSNPEGGRFFLRMVFSIPNLPVAIESLRHDFDTHVAPQLGLEWRIVEVAIPKRVAVMVSRYDHCLLDLLWRARRHELPLDIGLVISNHPDLESDVRSFGVPYAHIPVTRDTKSAAEQRQLELLHGDFDLIVLARYMQILSSEFLDQVRCPIINIHHSFLPSFVGASPYEQAKKRGVKLIGATAHYVTEELDEGPIIEQDVVRVNHRASVADLTRLGAEIERNVLSRAVKWHCEDRVLRQDNTTVVFS